MAKATNVVPCLLWEALVSEDARHWTPCGAAVWQRPWSWRQSAAAVLLQEVSSRQPLPRYHTHTHTHTPSERQAIRETRHQTHTLVPTLWDSRRRVCGREAVAGGGV
jgi:hypothetical protein